MLLYSRNHSECVKIFNESAVKHHKPKPKIYFEVFTPKKVFTIYIEIIT